jgi:hypothetical protein
VANFTYRPLYPGGKSPRYPLERRLGGPQNQSGRRGEEKILLPPGLELGSLGRVARSQSLTDPNEWVPPEASDFRTVPLLDGVQSPIYR